MYRMVHDGNRKVSVPDPKRKMCPVPSGTGKLQPLLMRGFLIGLKQKTIKIV